MECDTDFSHCPYQGRYDDSMAECQSCTSAAACRWLREFTAGAIKEAPLTVLVDALQGAVDYVGGRQTAKHPRDCGCDNCVWLRTSRRFLRSLPA